MSDNWNRPSPDEYAENNSYVRSGSSLRDYRQQQQLKQYSPISTGPLQNVNPDSHQQTPASPPARRGGLLSGHLQYQQSQQGQQVPPAQVNQAGYMDYAGQPAYPGQPGQQLPRGLLASTMQTVRRLSGKMGAVPGYRVGVQPPPSSPLPSLHPSGDLVPLPRSRRWRRSLTVRIAMQRRHRRGRLHTQSPVKRLGSGMATMLLLFVIITLSSGSAYAYSYYQSQLPRLQGLANQQISQTTHIYDRNGVLLYDSYDQGPGGGRRTPITYNDVPQVMKDAMIAAEDKTFWQNSGVDPMGILRAATSFAQAQSVQGGGSTITQQLIKNLTGDAQVSLNRKLPEAALAIGLTNQYPKWKILEMYFNVTSFGAQDLGVESATEEYFNLDRTCDMNFHCIPAVTRLDYGGENNKHDPILALARASLLAGMPQNPVDYDPTFKENLPRALSRQDYVLHEMLTLGMKVDGMAITPQVIQKAEALTAKMKFSHYIHAKRAPHFVEWVIKQLTDQLGVRTFLTGGFNIRTTIDVNLEAYVEAAVTRHLTQPEYQMFIGDYGPLNTVHNVNDSAVVVMNAKTGEVLAMDGSADFNSADPHVNGQFNAAVAPRQPGSSFKPIVYASAFQMGWYPSIPLPDVKTYFPSGGGTNPENNYHPTDYGNTYGGSTTSIRSAVATSRNVPAVKTLMFAGIDNVATVARRMGITAIDAEVNDYNMAHGARDTVAERFGPALALGSADIPLIQMAGAYQVFADQGQRIPPQGVLDIWDNYGHHLFHYDPTRPPAVQVMSPQVAYLVTSMLSDEPARYPEFLNDHILSFNDWDPTYLVHQVAAKTGTTDSFKDNWTMGYTPDVVVGVWSGNADNSDMYRTIGLTGAAPIWHSVIERVSGHCNYDDTMSMNPDDIPCGNFDFHFNQGTFIQPPGIVQQPVNSMNGLAGSGTMDWMLDGEQPLQSGFPSSMAAAATPSATPTPHK